MTWRVIVRMSFTGNEGSRLRYQVEKCLAACGLKHSKMTGTWEGRAVSAASAAKQFAEVLKLLSDPTKIGVRRAQLDHLWIYIDRAAIPKAASPIIKSTS